MEVFGHLMKQKKIMLILKIFMKARIAFSYLICDSLFFPDITSEFTKLNESSLVTGLVVGTANDWISTKPSQNFTLWSELFSITEVKGKGTNNV